MATKTPVFNKIKAQKINELYICEKFSQASDIARVLHCDNRSIGFFTRGHVVVTWCVGHLLELAMPDYYCANIKPWRLEVLPIVPDEWKMVIKDNCKKQLTIIKDLLKRTETVVIATDADREGEVIAREILDLCRYKGEIKRLWLSALDDSSITKALHSIQDGKKTENLYYAGLGRQRADWLIGMNMTMATSVLHSTQGDGVLSVGRVQTPTLKLVVDRDYQIENFTSKDYFELIAQFTTKNQQSFYAKWKIPETECDPDGYCIKKEIISSFAAKVRDKIGHIEKYNDEKKKQSPPICLSLSQLQKLASSKFNMPVLKTLEVAQSLYETHKATTYPRTDCGYLPESQFSEAPSILENIKKLFKQNNLKKNETDYWNESNNEPEETLLDLISACDAKYKSPTWNDKKITAHHGIVPTLNPDVDLSKMNDSERNIFELICRYYIAQFLGEYEYSLRSVTVLCSGETFKASNHAPLIEGWKSALKYGAEIEVQNKAAEKNSGQVDPDDETHLGAIPELQLNESVQNTEKKIVTKQTRPPARFTEGTLIEAMKSIGKNIRDEKLKKILKETAGIGTEATRANIIQTLFNREYMERKGKQLFSTEKGRKLLAHLPPHVSDPTLTAEWEQALDNVAQGQLKLESFLHLQNELLQQMLGALQQNAKVNASSFPANSYTNEKFTKTSEISYHCEVCRGPLIQKKNSKMNSYFWGCSSYPKCRFTSNDVGGRPEKFFNDVKDKQGE